MRNARTEWQVIVAPPVLHEAALNRVVSETMESSAQRSGPMQHLAILGPPGSGKTFLIAAMENQLAFKGFRGVVVRLPEFAGHIQSPRDFIAEVYAKVEGRPPDATAGWEAITTMLDKLFTVRSLKRRLLVVVAENFPELIRRAFPAHADQAKLRNWLDRSESRVMMIATATAPVIDAEPGDPLFGIFVNVPLEPIDLNDAQALLAGYAAGGGFREPDALFRFLYLLGDRTPRSVETLAHSYLRYLKQDWNSILLDYKRVNERAYEAMLSSLGQRAAMCLHAILSGSEPVTQSGLAATMGVQQPTIAQPFAEMRRKNLLREESAPSGRSKLVSVADRFFVGFYREKVLGLALEEEPIRILAEMLDRTTPPRARDVVTATVSSFDADGRAVAFRTFLDRRPTSNEDRYYWRALALELAAHIGSPDLLRDIAPVVSEHDRFAGELLQVISDHFEQPEWPYMLPEVRALLEVLRPPARAQSPAADLR